MRVALVNPWAKSLSWFFYSQGMATPPVGMVSIATELARAGHDVRVFDGQAGYEPHSSTLERVLAFAPDVVGVGTSPLVHLYSFMSTTATPYWLAFAARLRSAGFGGRLLGGGTWCSRFPQQALEQNPALDGVVVGEGNRSVVAYVAALAAGATDGVPGIATGDGFTPVDEDHRGRAPRIDLSLLDGWPGSYGVDSGLFLGDGPRHLHPTLPVLTARGCPFRCTFCPTPLFFDGRFQADDLETAVDRIAASGMSALSVWDDTFTVAPKRVERFCDLMIERGLRVAWWCFGRTEWVLKNRRLLPKMARAGLRMMWLGVESGEADVLEGYGRSTPFDRVQEAVRLLAAEGILPTTSFIVGPPDVTEDQLQREQERAAILYDLGTVNVFTLMIPLPGTKLHADLRARGLVASDDLRLYSGTRAVLRYPHVDAARVEGYFYENYRWSILGERFLGSVGRANLWQDHDAPDPPDAAVLQAGFEAEVRRARSLELEALETQHP